MCSNKTLYTKPGWILLHMPQFIIPDFKYASFLKNFLGAKCSRITTFKKWLSTTPCGGKALFGELEKPNPKSYLWHRIGEATQFPEP